MALDAPTENQLGDGEVLLEVVSAGICGSDLPLFRGETATLGTDESEGGGQRPGMPIHEVVGLVSSSRHARIKAGQSVVGWATRWDGLSQLLITDGDGLTESLSSIPPEIAVMAQPLACVLYAVDRLDAPLDHVAIIGLGPIGLLFSHVLKSNGVRHITGIDPLDRRDVASDFGVDDFVHAPSDRWVESMGDARRPEVVVEAVGHQATTLGHAIRAVGHGGLVYYFGIADEPAYVLDLGLFLRKNLTMRAGVAMNRRHFLGQANRYLVDNPSLALRYVTDRLSMAEPQHAFELAERPHSGQVKVTLVAE